jgi:hypothetical protein
MTRTGRQSSGSRVTHVRGIVVTVAAPKQQQSIKRDAQWARRTAGETYSGRDTQSGRTHSWARRTAGRYATTDGTQRQARRNDEQDAMVSETQRQARRNGRQDARAGEMQGLVRRSMWYSEAQRQKMLLRLFLIENSYKIKHVN